MATKYLDLDSIAPKVDFTFKLNGKEHHLVEPSVETALINMREIDELGMSPGPEREIEVMINMISRSFPTIKDEELRKLTLTQLEAISTFARQAGGEVVEEQGGEKEGEGKEEAANS